MTIHDQWPQKNSQENLDSQASIKSFPYDPQYFESKFFKENGYLSDKWYYTDKYCNLIGWVERFDLPHRKEIFRPWDAKTDTFKIPKSIPLYNQVEIAASNKVILVGSEKCADSLNKKGICATTVMSGANTPVDQTDWSPLLGKHVLIWPDNNKVSKEYSDDVVWHLASINVASVYVLSIPKDKSEGWNAADAVTEKMNIDAFIKENILQMFVSSENDDEIDLNDVPTLIKNHDIFTYNTEKPQSDYQDWKERKLVSNKSIDHWIDLRDEELEYFECPFCGRNQSCWKEGL